MCLALTGCKQSEQNIEEVLLPVANPEIVLAHKSKS